ncbi:hypothetical protein ACIP88_06615 [Streptomyces uncialis]|uniref:hypothetical protein n=1 Tax=Streptomyces uncialis TaxID=1048205 RepID=UPI0037F62FDF
MTVCAIETTAGNGDQGAPRAAGGAGAPRHPQRPRPAPAAGGLVVAADGGYAARLALAVDGPGGPADRWFPERWTLDGPEPYAVPLPGRQPEESDTEVQPLADGRVLVRRTAAGRHHFALLYPTGPVTGEVPLGALDAGAYEDVRLMPPAPGGTRAYVLASGPRVSRLWLVAGGAFGPQLVTEVPGRCSGGVWLDRAGRLLALDREQGGRVKAVVVDLGRGGEMSPLLQITQDSNDRVLLADPDSGLLLVRSDAPSPGHERLGWGVLGSDRPVRFPECLRLPDCAVTPFAVQPGQALTPESSGVALRIDDAGGSWPAVWRPAGRTVHRLAPPEGWLAGAGLWTRAGELRLPYATAAVPCGVARLDPGPPPEPGGGHCPPAARGHRAAGRVAGSGEGGSGSGSGSGSGDGGRAAGGGGSGGVGVPEAAGVPGAGGAAGRGAVVGAVGGRAARPVPLQEAPLGGRVPLGR